jgi:hypothetical protein
MRQVVVSYLASCKSEIALDIFERGILLDELMDTKFTVQANTVDQFEHALSFWFNVS